MNDDHDKPRRPSDTSKPQQPDAREDDNALFRKAMAQVRPLHYDKVSLPPPPPPPRARQRERECLEVASLLLSDPPDNADMDTGEEVLFFRPGLQHALIRKLRRGQLSMRSELDLHGMTVSEAREALTGFLHDALARGLRGVRIIHGKGHGSPNRQPVLKTHVNYWLHQRDEILAFCSARPVDGGTGAVYVLLRRT